MGEHLKVEGNMKRLQSGHDKEWCWPVKTARKKFHLEIIPISLFHVDSRRPYVNVLTSMSCLQFYI